MVEIKDFVKDWNVIETYQTGKYMCFNLMTNRKKFGYNLTLKIDPNKVAMREGGAKK